MATFSFIERLKVDYEQAQTSPCHPATIAAMVMPIQQTTMVMITVVAIPMGKCY